MLGQRDGDRVRLLSGGATGAPSSDGAVPFLPAQDLGNDLVDEVLPDLRISEETGDIDEDVVEQLLEFIWMNLEVILIRGVGIDSHIMHAFGDPALQARPLVPGEVEGPARPEEFQEGLEVRVDDLSAQSVRSPVTGFVRAEAISSSGSTKSTFPVSMAAEGIPKNSDVVWSWAITVPPSFWTAARPIAPSTPVPVRTTATTRSRKLAATDSNRRSADGRRKCTSSVWVSETVPSALTRRWRLGGAISTAPGRTVSPSSASFTLSWGRLARMSAIRLRCRGSRCWMTTMPAGKPEGSSARIRLTAFRPPADAASATTSKAPSASGSRAPMASPLPGFHKDTCRSKPGPRSAIRS